MDCVPFMSWLDGNWEFVWMNWSWNEFIIRKVLQWLVKRTKLLKRKKWRVERKILTSVHLKGFQTWQTFKCIDASFIVKFNYDLHFLTINQIIFRFRISCSRCSSPYRISCSTKSIWVSYLCRLCSFLRILLSIQIHLLFLIQLKMWKHQNLFIYFN